MENKTQTQNKEILAYLKEGNSLTPIEALNKFSTLRLGARIFELKKDGHNIKTEMIKLANNKRVAKYSYITAESSKEIGLLTDQTED